MKISNKIRLLTDDKSIHKVKTITFNGKGEVEKVTVKLKNSQVLIPFWADEFEFILEENKG